MTSEILVVWQQLVLEQSIAPGINSSARVQLVTCRRESGNFYNHPSSIVFLITFDRYANMDYLFFSSLRYNEIISLVISYDIICQWFKHLWHRMKVFPHSWHVDHDGKISVKFLIPKFHLPAHIQRCH